MTLEQLKQQERELEKQLRENKRAQESVLSGNFMQKSGFGVGSTIEVLISHKPRKAVVEKLYTFSGETVWSIDVRLFNKDGSPSKNLTRIYHEQIENAKVIQQ